MHNRREFLALAGLAAGSGLLPGAKAETHVRESGHGAPKGDLTQFVNVFIGTGGHGHTFPGATVPFGAVQLSPDTGIEGWDWCSGYHHSDATMMGFSHTHLSGTGANDLLDVMMVPRTGNVVLSAGVEPAARTNIAGTYRVKFSHDDEKAEVGYYSVVHDGHSGPDGGGGRVHVELTATERTGLMRVTFPPNEPAHVLVDWHHGSGNDRKINWAKLNVTADGAVSGGRSTTRWSPDRELYFSTQFSVKPEKVELLSDDAPVSGGAAEGKNLKAVLHFKPGSTVLIKTGISMVSVENAAANLKAEQTGWDFEGVRAKAKRMWATELGRIQIDDASAERKTVFYTSLYHQMCAPTLNDDVTGEYRGLDKQVHKLEPGEHNYSTYSLWDTFRAQHPSFTLWQQERVAPLVNGLIRMAEQSKYGFPIWPLQDGETYCMPGYHGASVMAEAIAKKVPGIDAKRAYVTMRKRNLDDNYMGLDYYRKMGYMPADVVHESIGKLVEYGYCDWACAKVAEMTGHADDAKVMKRNSRNYRNVFDKEIQFIRPKLKDGSWAPNFNPKATGHTPKYRDYTEANAWQSTFFVQHDVKGYMELFGGREAFGKKLDALFTAEPGVSNEDVADMTGFIGQYVHGNEPSHHIAFLYLWSGQPWKSQERVREVLLQHYRADYDGLDGNEDCGQMSAWFVMAAMGLYAVDPVSATYVLTPPLFDKVTINMPAGKKLVIEARKKNPDDKYIQSVTVNGKPMSKLWVEHEEIVRGGRIVFTLGPEPNKDLGTGEAAMPPSLTA